MTPIEPDEPTKQIVPDEQSGQAAAKESANAQRSAHSRRAFLFKLSLLANGAIGAILAAPIIGYFLSPALKRSSNDSFWIALGQLSDFPEGETRLVSFRNPVTTPWDGQTGDIPCWVRHVAGTTFQVFAINCAHLGCPVRWFAQSKLFLCPCHGGAYYADGTRASGPPERGLFEYQHKIIADTLMIKAGKMPTLAQKACAGPIIPQQDGPQPLVNIGETKTGCASCQG